MSKLDKENIPLAKAAYKKQFTEAMIKMGVKPGPYYRKVGLPAKDPEDLESLIPLRPMYRMANIVALQEGIPNFGSRVAQLKPWHKIETLGPLIAASETLEALLLSFCKVASGQRSLADFQVNREDDGFWFGYHGPNIIGSDVQMELYRLTGMIQLVQLATGTSWRPVRVELRMPKIDMRPSCNLIARSNLAFSCDDSRFSVPDFVLRLPVNMNPPNTPKGSGIRYDINADFKNSLHQIILIYLHRPCKIESISKVTEIEVRTLQRRLKEHGTSFAGLYREARFEMAKNKLEKTSSTIAIIAAELGYKEATNFVRAFKKWSGMTPGQYRKQPQISGVRLD